MKTQLTHAVVLTIASSLLVAGTAVANGQLDSNAQGSSTAQSEASANRSGANVSGAAQSSGSATADNHNAMLAQGTAMNAELTRTVDSRHSKPGDPVSARTTQPARTEDGMTIPKGSLLQGHMSEAHARGQDQSNASMGIVFDKVVTTGGHEMALGSLAIQALAAADSRLATDSSSAAMVAMSSARGAGYAGSGLLGHTSGALGGTLDTGGHIAGSGSAVVAGRATGALQAAPGAVGGLDASGFLTANSTGVFGIKDLNLTNAAVGSTRGSVITSTGRSVHLEQGTRMLLGVQSGAAHSPDAARTTSADQPAERTTRAKAADQDRESTRTGRKQ